MTTYRPTKE